LGDEYRVPHFPLSHDPNHDLPEYDNRGQKGRQQDSHRGYETRCFFNDGHPVPARGEGEEAAVATRAFIVAERNGKGNGLLPEAARSALQVVAAAGAFVVVELAQINSVFLYLHQANSREKNEVGWRAGVEEHMNSHSYIAAADRREPGFARADDFRSVLNPAPTQNLAPELNSLQWPRG